MSGTDPVKTRLTRHRWGLVLPVMLLCLGAGAYAGPQDGQRVAFEDVIANLKVGDPRVRLDALSLLDEAGYLEAAVPMAALFADPVSEVQVRAIESTLSLFLADEEYTRKYGGTIVKQRGASLPLLAYAQGPGALIPNPVPGQVLSGLVAALASPATDVRFNAAYALGVVAPAAMSRGPLPEASAAAGRLLADAKAADPTLRLAATHVLGRLFEAAGDDKAHAGLLAHRADVGDQIVAGMNDPDPLVRKASIRALGAMRYDRAVQALTDQLGYFKKGDEAGELLDALAHVAHASSLGVFSALLDNRDEQMRRMAVEGIGRTGDESAFDNLQVRVAGDRSKFVRQALAFLRVKRGEMAALTTVMEGFRNARLAPVAWTYLVELGPPIGGELATFASHKDWRIRAAAAEALGVIGYGGALVEVEGLTRDKNRNVASAARRSLNRLSPRPAGAPRPQ